MKTIYLDVKLYFLAFCLEDYTDLNTIYGAVSEDLNTNDLCKVQQATLELAEIFLTEGVVQVGEGLDEDFQLWEGTPHELTERIKQKWEAFNRSLMPHETVYFINTKKGKEEFELLNSIACLQDHDADSEQIILQKTRVKSAYLNVKLALLSQDKTGSVDLAKINSIVEEFSYGEDPSEIKRIVLFLLEIFLKEGIIEAKKIDGQWIDNPEAIVLYIHDNWNRLLSSPGAAHFAITKKGLEELKLFEGISFLGLKLDLKS